MSKLLTKLWQIFEQVVFHYSYPRYNYPLYFVAKRYCKFYENNENGNLSTNGELFFITSILKQIDPEVLFDIGANKGEYSQLILDQFPDCIIHCFEPDSRVFSILKTKYKNINNIKLNHLAVSDHNGKAKFYLNKDPGLNSLFDMNNIGYHYDNMLSTVSLETIDNYCKTHYIKTIDFVKIDVEGAELSVLMGGPRMLSGNRIKMIQFEYGHAAISSKTFLKDIYDLLLGYNYTIYKIMPLGLLHQPYSPYNEHIAFANYLAVNSKVKINSEYLINRPDIYRQVPII
ncbi:MAG: hypothetical protein UX91_C0002G0043 [Candidatus Amesbacteria bacterium GW2011_GWB1_47_19]|nr:MAG: hypothetical protein UW51_C0004G0043 [Candidatus Amesbacteria bacterium GW2011_GWA1_44_24]KKU31718.1 MAG: FkbM family methyltransferase [Candidatus Amesbacteria bacterium GW2011_GWC1_46_24]KKU67631.1 MAG: hypothetical protein UX91_C0002G0043 [Candidatus Amesbacteria bacterium GW2011_GWB1_47_19]OGD06481.1 MAG: hypothetical protein A2379_02465 [Candidatus Amesbacteria bacterium RIFOXYB1_FULL_47_13]HBC72884.1 hypothetical protein [Candidatus Amesbacteria bacterium]